MEKLKFAATALHFMVEAGHELTTDELKGLKELVEDAVTELAKK